MEDILICKDLVKQHRGRGIAGKSRSFKAVDGVSFSVPRTTTFGLVGESGCGKTTLARAILYLDKPTSGTVSFDNVEIGKLSAGALRKFRKRIQIVFQDPNSALNPKMTIFDSLQEGLINLGVPKQDRIVRIKTLLDRVGISYSHRERYPHEFSGGQKQRIVIARTLTMEPDFLVLDEPVSNLDVSIQAQIINLLSDLKDEFALTYFFISHDLKLVSYLSDTIAVMFRGKIVEQAPAEALVDNPAHPYTQKLFNSVPGKGDGEIAEPEGEDQAGAEEKPKAVKHHGPAKGCPYNPACPWADSECLEEAPLLKDIGGGHVVSCFKVRSRDSSGPNI